MALSPVPFFRSATLAAWYEANISAIGGFPKRVRECACLFAAACGSLEALAWARDKGSPWQARKSKLDSWVKLLLLKTDHAYCDVETRASRPPGGAQVGAVPRLPLGREDVLEGRRKWPPGGAPMGLGQRRPFGHAHERGSGTGRPPGSAPVGAGPRLPLGRGDVLPGRARGPSGGAAVSPRQSLPLARVDLH
mmetsp:Transcript_9936/g.33729  ORF Transcript_9936/g.33729 Transcript_9936/m.33729 type:complete len:193 (-) Transcript_9936:129-707(-)